MDDEFIPKSRTEVTGKDGGAIEQKHKIDLSDLSEQELAILEHIVAQSK